MTQQQHNGGAVEVLISYLDTWEGLNTKDTATFDQLLQADDEEGLALLRQLQFLRRSTCCKQGGPLDAGYETRCMQYLQELAGLVAKVEPEGSPSKQFTTKWSSPLAGKPTSYFKLHGVAQELCMACFQLASGTRALALQQATASPDDPAVLAEAVARLRKAAGLHEWLHTRGLPRTIHHLPSDRPAELSMSVNQVMSQVVLAEAQSLMAIRAGQRGSGAGLVAALHGAAWRMWEAAARQLKIHGEDAVGLTDRLRRFCTASAALAKVRALRWWARELTFNQLQGGQGEAACRDAAVVLKAGVAAAETDASWRAVLLQEQQCLDLTKKEVEKQRLQVLLQSVARDAPDLPPPKPLVTATPCMLEGPPAFSPPLGSPGGQGGSAGSLSPGAEGDGGLSIALSRALNKSLRLRQ